MIPQNRKTKTKTKTKTRNSSSPQSSETSPIPSPIPKPPKPKLKDFTGPQVIREIKVDLEFSEFSDGTWKKSITKDVSAIFYLKLKNDTEDIFKTSLKRNLSDFTATFIFMDENVITDSVQFYFDEQTLSKDTMNNTSYEAYIPGSKQWTFRKYIEWIHVSLDIVIKESYSFGNKNDEKVIQILKTIKNPTV